MCYGGGNGSLKREWDGGEGYGEGGKKGENSDYRGWLYISGVYPEDNINARHSYT